MIDSHCHLHLCQGKPEEILTRARDAGVSSLIQVATNVETYQWGKRLKEKDLPIPVYLSLGLYPSEAEQPWEEEFEKIKNITQSDTELVAIGEAGLDFYWDTSYNDRQEKMLQAQIELAIELQKPLILHCRKAYSRLHEILCTYKGESRLKGVWHCFDGQQEEAESFIELGFYISLAGIVTFNSAKELKNTVLQVPLDWMMIETDSPYLSPAPKRGQKNEPAHVAHTLGFLSQLLEKDPQVLESVFDRNTRNLFSLTNS